jgi:prevent-host-death family protein
MPHMRTVGIRQLQQHASAVIRDVKAGESIDISERGRVVARLIPVRAESTLERLVAAGLATPATVDFAESLLTHPPLPADPEKPTLSEIIQQMRDEDDR